MRTRDMTKAPAEIDRGLHFLSGRPGSNWRPQPWQGCALPTELRPHCSHSAFTGGASTTLPDPPEWSCRSHAERVTGIAHCAFPLEGGCSTTELHPRAAWGSAFSALPLGVLQTL